MADGSTGPIILDTHLWIWAVEGLRDEISTAAIREIEDGSRRGEIRVSAISVWEVAMLEAQGRIGLSRPVEEWVGAALRAPGVRLLELSPRIAIDSTRLPGRPPADPADRMLIASARVMGGRLATRDRGILEYAAAGHLAVVNAAP
jgi:PIN domain nuclease of toxin-antitoxin system